MSPTNLNSETISSYFQTYVDSYYKAIKSIDLNSLDRAFTTIVKTIESNSWIYFCGNGGSAEISNHMECDHLKGTSSNTSLLPRVKSLSSNVGLISAVANDIDYSEVYSYQLSRVGRGGDLLISVSSSGNSTNIIKAQTVALSLGITTIALTGFNGGESKSLANISLHVPESNYGIVEDAHQSILHILAQYIRKTHLTTSELITY